jgi:hypothetical protein
MAIENEELQQLMEELRGAFGGLSDSTTGLTDAQKKLKKQVDATMQAVGGVAKFGAAVGKGETDLKAFNGIIDTATGLVGSLAKTVPVFGDALAGLAKGIGEASKMAVDALDNTAKSFVEIGKVGGLTAKGMSGVREQFIRSGLSLQSFQKQVVENSQALAKFRGLTGTGADEFASIVGDLTQDTSGAGIELRRLGLNADEIAVTTAAFVTQQTRLGRSQAMTQQQLTAGTIQYAQELDELTKVTGLSRDAIQKQQDAALSESRFRANYETLMANGQVDQAKALMAFQSQMQAIGPELGQGARDLASGAANTDAARKLLTSTGGAAQDIIEQIKSGNIDQYEAAKRLQAASRAQGDAARENARFVDRANSAFVDFAQQADLNNAQLVEGRGLVKKVQSEQTKGGDKLTDATVSAQQNLERMSQELNLLGFTLLPQAAVVVDAFSTAMRDAINKVNNALGIGPGPGGATGAGNEAANKAGAEGKGFFGRMGARVGAEFKYMRGQAAQEQLVASTGNPYAGLPIKQAESTAGGEATEGILKLARDINSRYGADIKYFSAFNDQSHDNSSAHTKGRAFDLVLNNPDKYPEVEAALSSMGAKVIGAARYPDAPHVHAEISAANGFNGIISGPSSGYRPNLTMHGTESISIQPSPNTGSASPNSDSGIMQAQLSKLEELVTVMKSQLSVSNKLLSYSS